MSCSGVPWDWVAWSAEAGIVPFFAQELTCFNAKLKILEHRQQRIAEVRAKYEWLMKELETTKQYLMLDPNKWLRECKACAPPPTAARVPGAPGGTSTLTMGM
jgi:hypothetical protein